ncbi:hypothetical protein LR48_Vigan05g023300 [Vigna angularis]|uniref:Uncharacterized protein n=1 Tax=Phaseolus angularis TaxID=3914 RepID=A0A0L9UJ95_PHAAN|nr:hypothetical protein LR48_Vigan05g023300 [Vigna angularis]
MDYKPNGGGKVPDLATRGKRRMPAMLPVTMVVADNGEVTPQLCDERAINVELWQLSTRRRLRKVQTKIFFHTDSN